MIKVALRQYRSTARRRPRALLASEAFRRTYIAVGSAVHARPSCSAFHHLGLRGALPQPSWRYEVVVVVLATS